MEKIMRRFLLITCMSVSMFMSGCVYSYDADGNEMSKEQMEETVGNRNIKKNMKKEITDEIDKVLPDSGPAITEVDWEHYFDGINGAAVVYTPSDNSYQIYNQAVALSQHSPCSTFKIVSSLIALENKIVVPEDSVRTWSGEVFWNENWNRDIDWADSFRTSCVWYFREIIDEIGMELMQEELDELYYGNCDISDWEGFMNTHNSNQALNGFWIESSLKISPKEQVEVMERIFGEQSVYSQKTQNYLKQVMLVQEQQNADISIYGKTGMGISQENLVDTWFTGFADTINGRSYFCVYMRDVEEKNGSSAKAKEAAIELLQNL